MLILIRTNILDTELDLIELVFIYYLMVVNCSNLWSRYEHMRPSAHVDNKEKDILILGAGPTQGLGEHSLTAQKMYLIDFTDNRKKCCLSLHYNGETVIYLLIAQKLSNLKQKMLILLQLHYVLETFQKNG